MHTVRLPVVGLKHWNIPINGDGKFTNKMSVLQHRFVALFQCPYYIVSGLFFFYFTERRCTKRDGAKENPPVNLYSTVTNVRLAGQSDYKRWRKGKSASEAVLYSDKCTSCRTVCLRLPFLLQTHGLNVTRFSRIFTTNMTKQCPLTYKKWLSGCVLI
jgi:hypothetical protein